MREANKPINEFLNREIGTLGSYITKNNERFEKCFYEILDYLFVFILGVLILYGSHAHTQEMVEWDYKYLTIAEYSMLIVVIIKTIFGKKWIIKDILLSLLFCGVYFISAFITNWDKNELSIILFIALVIGSHGVSQKKIILTFLTICFPFCIINTCRALNGNITNLIYYRDGGSRMAFGDSYPTLYANWLLMMFIAYLWIRTIDENIKYVDIVLAAVLCAFCYHFCGARTSSGCLILLVICMCIYKTPIINSERLTKIKQIMCLILILLVPILAIISIVLSFCYSPKVKLLQTINILLSNRLYLGRLAFEKYSVLPFGQKIEMNGYGGTTAPVKEYFYLDSSYVYYLFRFGFIFLLIACLYYVYFALKEYRNKNYFHLILFSIVAVIWFMETTMLSYAIHPFLLMVFADSKHKVDLVNDVDEVESNRLLSVLKHSASYVVILIILFVSVWATNVLKNDIAVELDVRDTDIVGNWEDGYICSVDATDYLYNGTSNKGSISVAGWAAKRGEDMDDVNISVVLYDDNKYYKIPTYRALRPDVVEYFSETYNDDTDYKKSGFRIYTSDDFYGFPKEKIPYKVFIYVEDSEGYKLIDPEYKLIPIIKY